MHVPHLSTCKYSTVYVMTESVRETERERERERERLRERVCYVTARSMYVGERGNHPRVRKGDQKIEREKKG